MILCFLLLSLSIVACMAGTTIIKQQNNTTNNNNNTGKQSLSNLNSSCLWLQQPLVVESKSNRHKDSPMQQITTHSCHNSKSSTTTTTAAAAAGLTTYCKRNNNNYKQTRPFTLSTAALIMSLSIVFIQMPSLAYTKSIYAESPALAALSLDSLEADSQDTQLETEPERPSKLILSLFENEQDEEDISASSTARDILTSLDVLRHVEMNREYQKERRMRVRKRHTGDLIIKQFLNEHPQNLEWKNPCNVAHVNTNVEAQRVSKQQVYQVGSRKS